MRQGLIDAVGRIVQDEQRASMEKFPLFNSSHEGYAVIKEEFDELLQAVNGPGNLELGMGWLWDCVKENNGEKMEHAVRQIMEAAGLAACEAVQIAAMAVKFLESKDLWQGLSMPGGVFGAGEKV